MASGPPRRGTASPDCNACAHFYVTWDEQAPNGCRAFGFKSKRRPSLVVRESSGSVCGLFEPKPRRADTP